MAGFRTVRLTEVSASPARRRGWRWKRSSRLDVAENVVKYISPQAAAGGSQIDEIQDLKGKHGEAPRRPLMWLPIFSSLPGLAGGKAGATRGTRV
jgi:hypothetical protein